MHIHILGICGTFMGGLALIARSQGHTVTGSDENVYPPMSTQLESTGIRLLSGYANDTLEPKPDLVIVGNALSRGNPVIEKLLNLGIPYTSGAEWLAKAELHERWVIAVTGTHGKTTTSSMTAWILEYAGLKPGFLIGGVPANFGESARIGDAPFFVIEADEYDTAFFDKRAKFVHYRPRTAVINNVEFDHADIYPNLAAIETQFHHFIRTIPSAGKIICAAHDPSVTAVLNKGCWSEVEKVDTSEGWEIKASNPKGQTFTVSFAGQALGQVQWNLMGKHNQLNALAAIAAARHCGVSVEVACEALSHFKGIKRRMELKGCVNGISVYDDFAHHPTAIATTIAGLRAVVGDERIIAVIDPRSATMKMGVHKQTLAASLDGADKVIMHKPPQLGWDIEMNNEQKKRWQVLSSVHEILGALKTELRSGDHVLIMSNGGFDNIHPRLLQQLEAQ